MKKAALKKTVKRPMKKPVVKVKPKPVPLDQEAMANLQAAIASGRWMLAVFWVEDAADGQTVNMKRVTHQFPIAEFDLSVQLLTDNLKALK